MIDNKETLKHISFDPEKHVYKTKDGRELCSVSRLIEKYSNPFDPTGSILRNCSVKRGISEEELSAEWKKKANDAAARGTTFHEQAQYFIETGKIKEGSDSDIIKKFKKIKFQGKLKAETILFSEEYGIAGTCDLIEYLDDELISIGDFKTNEKLTNFSFNKQRLLPPISHLWDSKLQRYELQVSLYAFLLDEIYGYWINDLNIFHINAKKRDINVYPVKYRRVEVQNLLNHYIGKPIIDPPESLESNEKDPFFD